MGVVLTLGVAGCGGGAAGWTDAADGAAADGDAAGGAAGSSRAEIFGSGDVEGEGEVATGLVLGLVLPTTAIALPEEGGLAEGETATVGAGSGFVTVVFAGGIITTWGVGAPGCWAAACSIASATRLTAVERPAVAGGAPEIEMFGSVPGGATPGTPGSWTFAWGDFFCSIASSDRCTYSENSVSGAVFVVAVGVVLVVAATGKRTSPDRLANHSPKTNIREPKAAPSSILSKDCLD